jgi:peptide-methionine (S)-S-oxide reductase
VTYTRVGYTGGTKSFPTYHSLGDHTEACQVVFDPSKISFEQLLDKFWKDHNPTRKSKRQYMSGIWYTDDQQKEKIMKSKVELEKKMGKTIVTEIAPLGDFYLAEEYHQKYLDRSLR